MGVIREGTIHRWVPGFKVSGKKNTLTPCSPTEDLTENCPCWEPEEGDR